MDKNKALEIDKKKRKIIAARRTCAVLAILDIFLVVYIIIQFIFLAQR